MGNIIATLNTNKGNIKLELWPNIAPETVNNFVSLAKGEKEWEDPKTGQKVKKPYYDGLIFHRVMSFNRAGCVILSSGISTNPDRTLIPVSFTIFAVINAAKTPLFSE